MGRGYNSNRERAPAGALHALLLTARGCWARSRPGDQRTPPSPGTICPDCPKESFRFWRAMGRSSARFGREIRNQRIDTCVPNGKVYFPGQAVRCGWEDHRFYQTTEVRGVVGIARRTAVKDNNLAKRAPESQGTNYQAARSNMHSPLHRPHRQSIGRPPPPPPRQCVCFAPAPRSDALSIPPQMATSAPPTPSNHPQTTLADTRKAYRPELVRARVVR